MDGRKFYKVIIGDYKDHIGLVIKEDNSTLTPYPITLLFQNGDSNSYYLSSLEPVNISECGNCGKWYVVGFEKHKVKHECCTDNSWKSCNGINRHDNIIYVDFQ